MAMLIYAYRLNVFADNKNSKNMVILLRKNHGLQKFTECPIGSAIIRRALALVSYEYSFI